MPLFNSYPRLPGTEVSEDDELIVWDASSGGVRNLHAGELSAIQALRGIFELQSNKDTDTAMAAASDTRYPSQKAAKAYVDAAVVGLRGYVDGLIADIPTEAPSREISLSVVPPQAPLAAGDAQACFSIPSSMNGMNLTAAGAHVYTPSVGGQPAFQVRRKKLSDDSVADMLLTAITIDINERDSTSATAPAVIDPAASAVATGDEIYIDVDAAGTGAKGGEVRLLFRSAGG